MHRIVHLRGVALTPGRTRDQTSDHPQDHAMRDRLHRYIARRRQQRAERTTSDARKGDKRSSDTGSAPRARISQTQNAQFQRLADRLRAIDHVEFA